MMRREFLSTGGAALAGAVALGSTGTLAASLLDMDFKKSVVYIMAGVLLAGAIMLAASLGVFGAISLAK